MGKSEEKLDEFVQAQLDAIHEKIGEIDNHPTVRKAQELLATKARLQMAERALLGTGSRTTSSGGTRVTRDQVAANMKTGMLYTQEELAQTMGVSPDVIRGHLQRGNGETFIKVGSEWAKRDPEHGYNTAEDLEGEDDD